MRFLADENVSRLVIERLRHDGHDVMSIAETRPGTPDDDILNAADADARILITEDRDFGEMVIRRRLRLHGVILLELDRLANATEAEAVAGLVSAHAEKARRQSCRGRAWPHPGPPFASVSKRSPDESSDPWEYLAAAVRDRGFRFAHPGYYRRLARRHANLTR